MKPIRAFSGLSSLSTDRHSTLITTAGPKCLARDLAVVVDELWMNLPPKEFTAVF